MRHLAFVLSALATGIASTHAGPMLVIGSNSDSYEFGTVVDGRQPIRIDDGFVTLIAANGERVELEGPFDGIADPAPANVDTTLIDILGHLIQSEIDAEQNAPLRLFATVPRRRPDRWSADVTRSGTYCVHASAATLWRSYARRATTLTLQQLEPAASTDTPWPAGEATLAWPQTPALRDGAVYQASLSNAVGRTELSIRVIPDGIATDAHRAAWMAQHGCRVQALLVLDALAAGE